MSPEYIGALAEVIGALAVVVSLLYVARQVKQNGQHAQLMTIHSVSNQFHSVMQMTVQDATSARIWATGLLQGMDALDEDEGLLFGQQVGLLMTSYEHLVHYHREGLVDDNRLRDMERPYLAVLACPGFVDYWRLYGHLVTDEFRTHVEDRTHLAKGEMDLSPFDPLLKRGRVGNEPSGGGTA